MKWLAEKFATLKYVTSNIPGSTLHTTEIIIGSKMMTRRENPGFGSNLMQAESIFFVLLLFLPSSSLSSALLDLQNVTKIDKINQDATNELLTIDYSSLAEKTKGAKNENEVKGDVYKSKIKFLPDAKKLTEPVILPNSHLVLSAGLCDIFMSMKYRARSSTFIVFNFTTTVWKFGTICPSTKVFREINFCESGISKFAILTVSAPLKFGFSEFLHFYRSEIN